MKFFTLTFILVATFAVMALGESEPEPVKASRYRAVQIIDDAELDEENVDNKPKDTAAAVSNDGAKKGDASSGRLFAKKFLLFRNIFGNNQNQPIIPIIINGNNAGTTSPTTTSPTTTTTANVPTGAGTITTSPAGTGTGTGTGAGTGTGGGTGTGAGAGTGNRVVRPQQLLAPRGSYANNDNENDNENNENGSEDNDESAVVDEQTLAAALANGAEEYVVTEQEIKGTSDGKAIRGPARVNLRRRGDKNGKVVSVRIPPKYRRYFKNGQRVVVNNRNRPQKRRVVRRRVNRNRNKKNKNRNRNNRRRIVAA